MNTELIIILDVSGSMQPIMPEVITGFNNLVAAKALSQPSTKVSLITFAQTVNTVYVGKSINEVAPLKELELGYATAFYDGVHFGISSSAKRIREQDWANQVQVAIFTDGSDTCSRANKHEVRDLITRSQIAGWKIDFFGIDLNDHFMHELGIDPKHVKRIGAGDIQEEFLKLR